MNTIRLYNGLEMPCMGFGTIRQFGDQIANNVAFALNNGYDMIDTANRYDNEAGVARGLKRSGRPRDSYFLQTKLGPTLYENENAIDKNLVRLGVDYIDCMLLHHPLNNYVHAYHMLEKAYKAGKLRAIGISNFSVDQIREILDVCEIRPMVMQVEGHPYYPAEAVREYCAKEDIRIQTWFPLGHGHQGLMQEPTILRLAETHGKEPAQIILRWHVQTGFCPVPGSASEGHIRSNAAIFDFALTDAEMDEIAALNRHEPIYVMTEETRKNLSTVKCKFELEE